MSRDCILAFRDERQADEGLHPYLEGGLLHHNAYRSRPTIIAFVNEIR